MYYWIIQNALISNEWETIWVHKFSKIEVQNGDQITETFCKIGSPQKSGPLLFNLKKFEDSEKSTPILCRMHWDLMNDNEFGSRKLFKFNYRRGDQIIESFCKIGSPQKVGTPSLICRNLHTLRKVLINRTKCIEIYWMRGNLGP